MGWRPIYTVGLGVPQVGTLAFGVVDRGTSVLEVRPTSVCAPSCVFCSVNAGPQSRARWAEYVVEVEALLSALVIHISVFWFCLKRVPNSISLLFLITHIYQARCFNSILTYSQQLKKIVKV